MPEVICTTVYQFPELSEAAKEEGAQLVSRAWAPRRLVGRGLPRISSASAIFSASGSKPRLCG